MKKILSFIMAIFFLIQLGYAQLLPVQTEERTPKSNAARAQEDVLFTYNYSTTGVIAAFYWDGKVYTTHRGTSIGPINRFNISGNILTSDGSITVSGGIVGSNFTGFTTDGTFIYAVNNGGLRIVKINPTSWAATTISTSVAYSSIAYDKTTGGFWGATNGGTSATLLKPDGTSAGKTLTIPSEVTNKNIMGLAYDDVTPDGPYLITATGSSAVNNKATLGRWNITTGTYEEDIKNVADLPGGVATGNFMGSIFTYTVDEKPCLIGVSQGATLVFAYDITNLVTIGVPATVTGLSITPDATGALTADLNWTNPTKTVDGGALKELTAIHIYKGNEPEPFHTIPNPIIGGQESYTVTVPSAGMYSYKVAGENSAGESALASTNPVWIGPDVPAAPSKVELVNDDMTAILTWEAPVTGLHSGYFSGEGVVYDVYRFPDNVQVATEQTELTFTEPITQSAKYFYKVVAKNAEGEGGSANSNTEPFCMTISTFPWEEGFENGFNCWTQQYISGRELVWKTTTSEITPLSGDYSAYIGARENDYTSKLISPVLGAILN